MIDCDGKIFIEINVGKYKNKLLFHMQDIYMVVSMLNKLINYYPQNIQIRKYCYSLFLFILME